MELYDFFSVPRKVLAIRVAKMLISSILEIMKSCEAREPNTKEKNMRLLFQERYNYCFKNGIKRKKLSILISYFLAATILEAVQPIGSAEDFYLVNPSNY